MSGTERDLSLFDEVNREDTEFVDLHLKGAILYTTFADDFQFFPMSGARGVGSLAAQCKMDLLVHTLPLKKRKEYFPLQFVAGGEVYEAKLFCRVQDGNHNA